ncbi:MAG: hypothetical protein KKC75_02715, partial [Nanoarchaeota archaeon]|nr:hypothetical protein [Nanoarchaeota archaeon]MBU1945710.1 hypothetical protein [Nanoarchaeota archaeon]
KLLEVAKGGTIRIFEFGGGKPNISDPTNQRSNFGGITTRILKGMEIKPEQVELHECISEETINSTLDVLVPRV